MFRRANSSSIVVMICSWCRLPCCMCLGYVAVLLRRLVNVTHLCVELGQERGEMGHFFRAVGQQLLAQ